MFQSLLKTINNICNQFIVYICSLIITKLLEQNVTILYFMYSACVRLITPPGIATNLPIITESSEMEAFFFPVQYSKTSPNEDHSLFAFWVVVIGRK